MLAKPATNDSCFERHEAIVISNQPAHTFKVRQRDPPATSRNGKHKKTFRNTRSMRMRLMSLCAAMKRN